MMIRRSSTMIVKSETVMELLIRPVYSKEAVKSGITTAKSDMIYASMPCKIMTDVHKSLFANIEEKDADFYELWTMAGFCLDFRDDCRGRLS